MTDRSSIASADYDPADDMRGSISSDASGNYVSADIMLYGMPLHDKINEIDDRLQKVEEKLSSQRGGKTKKHKSKKNKQKVRQSRKNRGKGLEWKTTPITDKTELKRLEEYEKRAAEREQNDNEIKRIHSQLEKQRTNVISGFTGTPMDPKDIERQRREDEKHNRRVNSKKAKERKLTIYDLGGSKRKSW
jgi:hypothetical protein